MRNALVQRCRPVDRPWLKSAARRGGNCGQTIDRHNGNGDNLMRHRRQVKLTADALPRPVAAVAAAAAACAFPWQRGDIL